MAKKKIAVPSNLLLVCLFLGILFDVLFWGKPVGLSFPLFTLTLVLIGLVLARQSGVKPARASLWLLLPVAFFALVFVFRTEPLTLFVSWVATLVLLALFAVTFAGGEWPRFGLADYLTKLLGLVPLGALAMQERRKPTSQTARSAPLQVLRGLLFALPLLVILGILLSSADAYFADWMNSVFGILSFEKAPEYVIRGILISLIALVLGSVYAYALARSKKHSIIGEQKPLVRPFLGFGEAATMLASVNLLFAVFVAVQFRYFFGGLANIVNSPTGLTFAEYARRGFAELVLVAMISLVFFIGLSAVTTRSQGRQQSWFSRLGIFLFAMVAVMLVSAFQRLLLLEEAYGFTRLRTYPHVFMVWLGLLLLAIVILEARQRQRAFALAFVAASVGFAATLALLNVDNFIASVNIQRGKALSELDDRYLGSLSADAIPLIVDEYYAARSNGNDALANRLQHALTCYFTSPMVRNEALPWQSFNFSVRAATDAWQRLVNDPDFPKHDISDISTILGCFTRGD